MISRRVCLLRQSGEKMSIPHTQLDADNELRQEAENVLANDPATTDIYITPTTGLMWRTERLGFGWGGMINAHPPACSKAAMERWPHRCKVGLGGGTQRRCPNTNRVCIFFLFLFFCFYSCF